MRVCNVGNIVFGWYSRTLQVRSVSTPFFGVIRKSVSKLMGTFSRMIVSLVHLQSGNGSDHISKLLDRPNMDLLFVHRLHKSNKTRGAKLKQRVQDEGSS